MKEIPVQNPNSENSSSDKEREAHQKALTLFDRISELKDKPDLTDEEERELADSMTSLEKMHSPKKLESFEAIPNLKEQYETQRAILQRANILTWGDNAEGTPTPGLEDINGEVRHFPAFEEIVERLETRKEIIEKKAKQGFTKLLIVPFGMKLGDLIEKYKAVLLVHHEDGALFATTSDPIEKNQELELDRNEPVRVWGEYKDADTAGSIVYHPQAFTKNSGGLSKKTLLSNPESAWQILLIEDMPNIPRAGGGRTVGGRRQLEAGKNPEEYLKLLGEDAFSDASDPYSNESGLTPEDWLIYAITHLEETNQVIDDYRGNGSASHLTGSYFPASNSMPSIGWHSGNGRAFLDVVGPEGRSEQFGVRSAVRV